MFAKHPFLADARLWVSHKTVVWYPCTCIQFDFLLKILVSILDNHFLQNSKPCVNEKWTICNTYLQIICFSPTHAGFCRKRSSGILARKPKTKSNWTENEKNLHAFHWMALWVSISEGKNILMSSPKAVNQRKACIGQVMDSQVKRQYSCISSSVGDNLWLSRNQRRGSELVRRWLSTLMSHIVSRYTAVISLYRESLYGNLYAIPIF